MHKFKINKNKVCNIYINLIFLDKNCINRDKFTTNILFPLVYDYF